MARLVEKLTGRGDPVADLDRAIARQAADLVKSDAAIKAAEDAYEATFAAGLDDSVIDAASRQIELDKRASRRAQLKVEELRAERAATASRLKAERDRVLLDTALAAGEAYGLDHRRLAKSAAHYVQARYELESTVHRPETEQMPMIVPTVLDLSQSTGATWAVSSINPLVERFAFLIEALKAQRNVL